MRLLGHIAFAGVSLTALSAPAFAQGAPATEEVSSEQDIIVQARRKDESIQDVPLTVNAVTAETLEKLNIRDFKDIAAVVPGLVLDPGTRTTPQASLRGINIDVNSSGANTSVQFYLNDSVITSGGALQTLYDVGSIEVLRGPQGTLRGLASPSGSITITTRRPDLNEWGGYAQGTVTTLNGVNLNGAVNAPIIPGVLAVRVAGLFDNNESNRIRSITSPSTDPYSRTRSVRASLRFTPIDSIEVNASYTHLNRSFRTFDQVETATLANPALPVTGSPATSTLITARDRAAVSNVASVGTQSFDIFNWQARWSFAGQRLDYVGSYTWFDYKYTEPYDKGDYYGPTVPGDASLPNNTGYFAAAATLNAQNAAQATRSYTSQETHELRLSSDERLFGTFDYVAGLFVTKQVPWTDLVGVSAVNAGTGAVTPRFTNRRGRTIERAVFGNLTAHIGEKAEISGGIRFIDYRGQCQLRDDRQPVPRYGRPVQGNDLDRFGQVPLQRRFDGLCQRGDLVPGGFGHQRPDPPGERHRRRHGQGRLSRLAVSQHAGTVEVL